MKLSSNQEKAVAVGLLGFCIRIAGSGRTSQAVNHHLKVAEIMCKMNIKFRSYFKIGN